MTKMLRRGRARQALAAIVIVGAVSTVGPSSANATPLFKAATTKSRLGVSYLSVSKPATVVASDVLVGIVSLNQSNADSVVPPSGWALRCSKGSLDGPALTQAVYLRVATSGEPASYKWSFPANSGAVIAVLDYGGVDLAQPMGACAGKAVTSTDRIVAPAISTMFANETVVSTFAFRGSGTTSPPSGTTERFDNKTATDSGRSVSASAADSPAGIIGLVPDKVGTSSLPAPSSAVGIQFSLRPSSASTTTTSSSSTTTSSSPSTTTSTTAPTTAPVVDAFDGPDRVITSPVYYSSASFPAGGTSTVDNPSPTWEGDSGTFHIESGWGYSGRPVDWGNKYFFRFNTRNFSLTDAEMAWRYRSAAFGQDGYAVEGSDATNVWLRYQTQYNLYVWQFDRTNNCVQVKRKVPAQNWKGPPNLVSNKGVYYTLPTDAAQPIFGTGQYCITWNGVKALLPASEAAKPGFPNLAHDGTTVYDFKTTVRTLPDGKVQIQAYRAGVLVYSSTDDGRSGIAADGTTQGTHLDSGYYSSVTGWQSQWGLPITAPGASGFRGDNIRFWLDDFTMKPLS